MTEGFEYKKALEELEAIAGKIEDPETPLADIEQLITRSNVLIASCREYLRSARDLAGKLQ